MPGPSRADRVLPRRIGSFPGRAMVLHIGEGCLRGSIRGFPHDSGVLTRMLVFSARAPMCRADPSAHGKISTTLSVGVLPHDYADSPLAGPGRMCSTARPRPDAAHPGPAAPPRHRGSAPAPHPSSRTIARFPDAPGILSRRKGSLRHFGMGDGERGSQKCAPATLLSRRTARRRPASAPAAGRTPRGPRPHCQDAPRPRPRRGERGGAGHQRR